MPPKRRASGPATKSQQATLAFHAASNKVTKPNARAQGAKKNLQSPAEAQTVKPEVVEIPDTEPTTAEAAIIEHTEQEVQAQQAESTPDEDAARRISDAAIKRYWASKEKQRMAPRVHQEKLSINEKILREFDMSGHYGVSLRSAGLLLCDRVASVSQPVLT